MPIVAGGKCDLNLGRSSVQIRVKGCPNELHEGGYLEQSFTQNSFEKMYESLPAQFLEVRIIGVKDGDKNITHISDYFYGTDPIVKSINLLSTEEEDEAVNAALSKNKKGTGNTGTPGKNVEDIDSVKESEKFKETVRFQYDGELKLDFSVASADDKLDCNRNIPAKESFHVVEYMDTISVNIGLKFEIDKDRNLYCNLVDAAKHKISIESNLGMDRNAGFREFYDGLPSDKERELVSICSSISPPPGADGIQKQASGACLFDVESSKEFSGKKNLKLVVGRPNIGYPYTKNINIRVVGADNNVQHTAYFFVEGLFSKGP